MALAESHGGRTARSTTRPCATTSSPPTPRPFWARTRSRPSATAQRAASNGWKAFWSSGRTTDRAAWSCGSSTRRAGRRRRLASPSDQYRIAGTYPATGILSPDGVNVQKGYALAVDMLNEQGGIAGRPVELILRDDGSSPQAAADIYEEYVADETIDLPPGTVQQPDHGKP